MPFWFLLISTMCLSAAVILKRDWRFSLRTLLIATMLVALGLGMVVYL
jgi:hypothetical protein